MMEYEDYLIAGPPFDNELSVVDQVSPPVYSRRVLIFSNKIVNREETILALKDGLQQTVQEIPMLAGQMGLSATGWTIQQGSARLRIKSLDLEFSDLEASGFSESFLPADLLSSVPVLTDQQKEWHSCRLQANFIHGGLLLVISINHTTMDGYGISKVIEALARNCRKVRPPRLLPPNQSDRSKLSICDGPGNASRLAAYSVVAESIQLPNIPDDIVTTTFRISEAALKRLKANSFPSQGWITSHDALNGLCWRTHAKARHAHGLIKDDDLARFAFPVNFRLLTEPPLAYDYLGNAVLMNKVELPVGALIGSDGLRLASYTIRQGVKEVDARYVANFIAVANNLEHPRQMRINLKLRCQETAFGSTSYKSFSHGSLDWDDVLGKFERMRLCHGVTGDGMSIIMPVLPDGSWEVTVTLERNILKTFRRDTDWLTYVT